MPPWPKCSTSSGSRPPSPARCGRLPRDRAANHAGLGGAPTCDPSTVSLAADKLQSMGLVARQPHPTDGRKRTLSLTEQGHTLWDALRTRLHASGMFASLSVQEQDTLLALLTKMRNPLLP